MLNTESVLLLVQPGLANSDVGEDTWVSGLSTGLHSPADNTGKLSSTDQWATRVTIAWSLSRGSSTDHPSSDSVDSRESRDTGLSGDNGEGDLLKSVRIRD